MTNIVHVPSVQPLVIEAMVDIRVVPLHGQALLFSIYLMGVVSLTKAEHIAMFSTPKGISLRRYTLGAKASLVRFDFVRNENMAILQALILYPVRLTLSNEYSSTNPNNSPYKITTTASRADSSAASSSASHTRWAITVTALLGSPPLRN